MNATQVQGVKRLPFEVTVQVESRPCPACGGSGAFASRDCIRCRGYARLVTPAGRRVLAQLFAVIGGDVPVDDSGRFDERFLRSLLGRELTAGMTAQSIWMEEPKTIAKVERVVYGMRVVFEDGTVVGTTETAAWDRHFTESDVARANAFLAQFVGRGATEISE